MKLHKNKLDIDDSGNVTAPGYFTGKKCGVSAYLSSPNNVTMTEAEVYYPISGSFTNLPLEDFTLSESPAIKYIGTLKQFFKVDWSASIAASVNGTTVTFGVKKNGELIAGQMMDTFCKYAGEYMPNAGASVVELDTNDEIQLVLKSDGAGDVITIKTYVTTINEFFQ